METYRLAYIIKLATIDAAALFAIITFLLTQSALALAISLPLIVFFFLNKPSIEGMIKDLNLNDEEQKVLRDKDSII